MKLRRLPEDFQVDEVSQLPLGSRGPFAVYELRKTGWTTLDALDRLARVLNIARHRIQHAGLKDRHAVTSQIVTIKNGKPESADLENVALKYLGQSPRAVAADDIVANRFRIVVRSLTREERETAERALPQVQAGGTVNYFDDQRFGTHIEGRGFVAEPWLRGDYEGALRLLFAEITSDDDRQEREQKQILRDHWGDWATCKSLLAKSHRRSIITFLNDRPGDFKGAWSRVNADLRGLALSAFQSHLWNRIAAAVIRSRVPGEHLFAMEFKPGPLPCHTSLSTAAREELPSMRVPLPSARVKDVPAEIEQEYHAALADAGWPLSRLKIRLPRDRFFSRALRDLLLVPEQLSWEFAEDDLDPPRQLLRLSFQLPRGAYATMIVKRLLLSAPVGDVPDEV